jgi:UMF1 family MFS transporter
MAATVTTSPAERGPTATSLFSRPVLSWALFDLANTVFSMNIVSLFLGLWVVNVMGGTDTLWGRANSISMLMVLVCAPFLGAISDQAGRRLPFLLVSTIICVALTALLGVPGVMGTILLFVFANYFYQAGLIFYDATLPLVSTPTNRGRVSGFGVGIGYIGSFIGVAVGFALQNTAGYVWIFRASALLFALFAIPIFFFVKEPAIRATFKIGFGMMGAAARQVGKTFRSVKHYRGLGRFLIGRAFYTDAANTLIVFMGIYVTNEIGFTEAQTNILLMTSIAAAIGGGLRWGGGVDRSGPQRTLDRVLGCWAITLLLAALIPVTPLPSELFWVVASLAGISLGGTWASDRPYMLVLSPPAKIGEFYGLYGMIGRFAAVVGPLLWAFVAEDLGLGRPASVAVLLVMIVISWTILRGVDDRPREWGPEDMLPEGGAVDA